MQTKNGIIKGAG